MAFRSHLTRQLTRGPCRVRHIRPPPVIAIRSPRIALSKDLANCSRRSPGGAKPAAAQSPSESEAATEEVLPARPAASQTTPGCSQSALESSCRRRLLLTFPAEILIRRTSETPGRLRPLRPHRPKLSRQGPPLRKCRWRTCKHKR